MQRPVSNVSVEQPPTPSQAVEGASGRRGGPLQRLFLKWFGGDQAQDRGALLRLLGLFRPYRRQIIQANVLFVLGSFVGVCSLFMFLPILKVIFPQNPPPAVEQASAESMADSAERLPPPDARDRDSAQPSEKDIKGDLLGRIPLIGPLVTAGKARLEPMKANLKQKAQSFRTYLHANRFKGVLMIATLLLAAALLAATLTYAGNLLMARAENGTLQKLSQDIYDHCLGQDLAFFHKNTTGQLMTRIYNDVAMLRQPLQLLCSTIVREPFTMLFLLIFLFVINKTLTLIVLVLLPFGLIPTVVLARRIREISKQEVSGDAFIMDQMQTAFSGIKLVKSFGSERFESDRFSRSNESMFRRRFKRRMIKEMAGSTADMIVNVGVAGILILGALLMFELKVISGGAEFIVYLFALNRFYKPIKRLSVVHVGMQRALMSAERIFGIVDTQPRVIDPPDPLPWPEDWDFVRFEDVAFRYNPEQGDDHIFRHLNLWIPRNKVTAMIGRNGSGKSTLAALLCRFYVPTVGRIMIGPTPLDRISEKELRRRVVLLSQETILFNLSILENIAYGAETIDEPRAIEAARLTRVHDFVQSFPDGYQTLVGERGGRLSGGQARLLALARVLYRDPEILILDEPEAGLDVKNQAIFAEVFKNVARGRTTIMITHKLSSVLSVDKVVRVRRKKTRTIRDKRLTSELLEEYI